MDNKKLIQLAIGADVIDVAMENLDHDVWIGRYSESYADGDIANVKIYDRELSNSEILKLYKKGR